MEKLKILYITIEDFSKNNFGVINKIKSQKKAFENLGFICDIIFVKDKIIYKNDDKIGKCLNKYTRRLLFFNKLMKVTEENYKFIYIRYPGSTPSFLKFLKYLNNKKNKVVLEFPAYPYDNEAKSITMKIFIFIDKLFRKKLSPLCNLAVTYSDDRKIFGIETVRISNGIDVDEIKQVKEKKIKKDISFIGVAKISFWHGFDRFILGMYNYYKTNPTEIVRFNIVGSGEKKTFNYLKELVKEKKLEDYVCFHGYKTGVELDAIYDDSQLAISSLGIFRNNITTVSSLKTREYCAKGLPIILATDDKSFEKAKFIYKVPSDESPIEISPILKWYKENCFSSKEIRSYASSNLSWEIQLKKIIEYIK